MKEKISVMIVDDNAEFGNLLNEYMKNDPFIQIIGMASDGVEALEMVASLDPDVVLLDIIMPNLDGIGVLEKLKTMQLRKRPILIMLSAIGQDVFIQKAIELGAEYYMVKPFYIDILISRIKDIYKEKQGKTSLTGPGVYRHENSLESKISKILHEAGIPPHLAGYRYLREAVIQTVDNPDVINSVIKVLYPKVAEKFNSTPQKVERAMRNAIQIAWQNADNKNRPTNSEFISIAADKIKSGK